MDGHQAGEFQYRMTILLEAQIEMEAMKAQNQYRASIDEQPEYKYEDFMSLVNKYGIHHNAAVEAQRAIMR